MGSLRLIPEASQPIGRIAAKSSAWLRVLERHGVEFCYGGSRSLQQACEECGADTAEVISDLHAASVEFFTQSADWNLAPLTDLVSYICDVHHTGVRQSLPELITELEQMEAQRGTGRELPTALRRLQSTLEPHMQTEEAQIFPAIRLLSVEAELAPPLDRLLRWEQVMENDHSGFCRNLTEIALAAGAENVRHSMGLQLEQKLARFTRTLRIHLHLEANILLPRAIEQCGIRSRRAC